MDNVTMVVVNPVDGFMNSLEEEGSGEGLELVGRRTPNTRAHPRPMVRRQAR